MCVLTTFHDLLPYLECYSYYLLTFIHKQRKKITMFYIKLTNSLLVKEKELRKSKDKNKQPFFLEIPHLPLLKKYIIIVALSFIKSWENY